MQKLQFRATQQIYQQQHHPPYCFSFCQEACIQRTLRSQFFLSTLFSIFTVLISIYHVSKHLNNFNNPFFQSKIIIIMIMAPFYCITSMGSFIYPKAQAYLTLTRDCYEALLLFTFFYLIFSYLAYDRELQIMEDKKVYLIMIEHEKQIHHFFPFGLCQKPYQLTNWKKAKYFTYRCKKYVLQFLVVKLLATLILYIIYPKIILRQQQGEIQSDSYESLSGIINFIVAVSASYSLYYLVLFYHALSKPLAPYSPLLKFLTVKITLFFTFWQKIMLTIFEEQVLECFDQQAPSYQGRQIIMSLENTLICFEMFIMAFAGGLAYNYQNYISPVATNRGSFRSVIKDTIKTFKKDSRLIKPKKFGFDSSFKSERQLHQIDKEDIRVSVLVEKKIPTNLRTIIEKDYF